MKKSAGSLSMALVMSLLLTAVAFAAIPPPPVNQNLGFQDTIFNNLVEADCRFCHSSTPPPGIPVDPEYLPNRHHLKVGSVVPVGGCQETPNTCQVDEDCYDFCDITTTQACTVDTDCPIDPATGTNEPCVVGENYCVGESERPFPSGDTMGNYDCFSCHNMIWDPGTMSTQLEVFRDCIFCHRVEFQPDHPDRTQGLNQHHRTAEARAGNCVYCHGNLVDRGWFDTTGDGRMDTLNAPWIPTYDPSLVTPWPSGKNFGRCDETCDNIDPITLVGACSVSGIECLTDAECGGSDTQCVIDENCPIAGETCNLDLDGGGGGMPNARGTEQGNCNYCHDSSTTDICDEVAGICEISGLPCEKAADCQGPIVVNHDTHHLVGATAYGCNVCHPGRPTHTTQDMRACEACHGFTSLHNIQVDSNGDGEIVPNGEDPYFGHIGSNTDCNGCHGFSVASAPSTGPVIPFIGAVDDLTMTAGTDTTLTLTGVAFTNLIDTGTELIELASTVELTASDGSVTSLAPDSVSQTEIVVTLPGSLAVGNYHLRAAKGTKDSNPVVVSVTPAVAIAGADCNRRTDVMTISGSGFGDKVPGTDADINVEINGVVIAAADIISWSDTQIRISIGSCPKNPTVTVNSLYDSATLGDGKNKGDKPCNGKKC